MLVCSIQKPNETPYRVTLTRRIVMSYVPEVPTFRFELRLELVPECEPDFRCVLVLGGCGDAQVDVRADHVRLAFARPAGSLVEAIGTGLRDVCSTGIPPAAVRLETTIDVPAALAEEINNQLRPVVPPNDLSAL